MMLKVGLTGSIAVGKTFVCDCLRELGCHVLDADKTARDVVAKGTDGLAEVIKHFGVSVLLSSGELDRKKMAAIVFADDEKRSLLNSIVHPRVIEAQNEWLNKLEKDDAGAIAIVDAALMIESGGYKRFDKIIVVWCAADIQLSRLMARNVLTRDEAIKRIGAQMPQDEKKKFADYQIDTSNGFEDTRRQTTEIVTKLQKIAA
ncbi:MAG: dephospho-CoA kinase [Pyrinomonadaceae bacterium]